MAKNKYSKGRRSFLLGLGGFSALSLAHKHLYSAVQAEEINEYISSLSKQNKRGRGQSLRQIAASKGIKYGGFPQRSSDDISSDQKFKRIFTREYEVVVGGFFGFTVGPFDNNSYNFSQTDAFFNFANQNNLAFRGHPLIWNEFNSSWLVDKFKDSGTTNGEIDIIFVNHITTLAQRHAGLVSSWDVFNEAIRV
ncbi:MAG: endo-1,4-beta-xylanase, partial [Pleurocapsa sp.]